MSPLLMLGLGAAVLATSFLSGGFGMAGGLVLVGVLLPLPAAMALHAVTRVAANLWRGLLWRRQIRWSAALPFVGDALGVLAGWSLVRWVPGEAVALLLFGLCVLYIDRHLLDEVPSPQAFEGLRAAGRPVCRPDATIAVADHNLPT